MQRISELTPLSRELEKYWASVEKNGPVEIPEVLSADKCPDCGGAGFYTLDVPTSDPLFGKAQRCTNPDCAAAQEAVKRQIRNYGLKKAYLNLTFETWRKQVPATARPGKELAFHAACLFAEMPDHEMSRDVIAQRANHWFDGPDTVKNSLALFGPVGVGKTGLVAAIMNMLSRKRQAGVMFRRTSDLILDLQGAYDDHEKAKEADERSITERISQYQRAGVLILDEWRMQKMTEPRLQWMEDIIRYRHGNRLPTVITTNLDENSIYNHWTEQTADVALEMAHWIPMGGEALRQTQSVLREDY